MAASQPLAGRYPRIAGASFCLATTGHLSSNPRIVKEADALAEAGGKVTLVGMANLPQLLPFDREIAAGRPWRYEVVHATGPEAPATHRVRALLRRILRTCPRAAWVLPGVLEGSYNWFTGALACSLATQGADMYIAHNLAALPAAARAAKRFRAVLGFDAEDYHAGELPEAPENDRERARIVALEERYIPACHYLTASSPEIASLYAGRFGRPVASILNVFPLSDRDGAPAGRPPAEGSLYWFSQTIGPGRGLEAMLMILGRMRAKPLLQLRGTCAPGFEAELMRLAREAGVAERLRILPRASAKRMVALAAEHTLGLAIEPGETLNHQVCLSNKAFTCLLAGLPVVLSDTPAQRRLAGELGEACRLIRLDDAGAAAVTLDAWLADDAAMRRSREAARKAARDVFNWDAEREKFLAAVTRALEARAP